MRIAGLAGLCAATLVAPALVLVWMPILLGVPHVANDLRYLVIPLPRRQVVVALVASALLVAVKATSLSLGVPLLRVEMIVVALWLLVALALGTGRAPRSHAWARHGDPGARATGETARHDAGPRARHKARATTIFMAAAGAAIVIVALPLPIAFVAAMAHNLVAIVVWLLVRRPDRRHALAMLATIIAAIAVIAVAGSAVASATGGDVTRWLTIDRAASLMFGAAPLPVARTLLIAFAFLQAVHYAIWLGWMTTPPTTLKRRTRSLTHAGGVSETGYYNVYTAARSSDVCAHEPGSYKQYANRFRQDPPCGGWRFVMTLTTAVVIGAALVDVAWARTTYLALATFHIYLELVVLAVVLVHRPLLARLRATARLHASGGGGP